MNILKRPHRRSLVLPLLVALLGCASLLMGRTLAQTAHPLVRRSPPAEQGTLARRLADWRRSIADPKHDPRVGTPAPEITLRTEGGTELRLADFRGEHVALLFLGEGFG